jgi:type IV fimbrial biogenesis protein FimT
MLSCARQRGVTLIELMIGITILAILLMAGLPSFGQWIQNAQVRSAAESIQSGLQLARTEAVRRNASVRFSLTDTGGLVAWKVGCVTVRDDCPDTIQERSAIEGGENARVGIATAADATANTYSTALATGAGLSAGAGATFNGFGTVPDASTDIARIDVLNAVSADARRLVIIVGSGGLTRMCDPALSLPDYPQGCPADPA